MKASLIMLECAPKWIQQCSIFPPRAAGRPLPHRRFAWSVIIMNSCVDDFMNISHFSFNQTLFWMLQRCRYSNYTFGWFFADVEHTFETGLCVEFWKKNFKLATSISYLCVLFVSSVLFVKKAKKTKKNMA